MNGQANHSNDLRGVRVALPRQLLNSRLPTLVSRGVLAIAMLLAIFGARPYAGSWNDGSRLAAVESLLDRGTLAIDDSMFVNPALSPAGHNPYSPGDADLQARGTSDKLQLLWAV